MRELKQLNENISCRQIYFERMDICNISTPSIHRFLDQILHKTRTTEKMINGTNAGYFDSLTSTKSFLFNELIDLYGTEISHELYLDMIHDIFDGYINDAMRMGFDTSYVNSELDVMYDIIYAPYTRLYPSYRTIDEGIHGSPIGEETILEAINGEYEKQFLHNKNTGDFLLKYEITSKLASSVKTRKRNISK